MCQLFGPNVSSFRPDVFTLAGQVFSFGSARVPSVQTAAAGRNDTGQVAGGWWLVTMGGWLG